MLRKAASTLSNGHRIGEPSHDMNAFEQHCAPSNLGIPDAPEVSRPRAGAHLPSTATRPKTIFFRRWNCNRKGHVDYESAVKKLDLRVHGTPAGVKGPIEQELLEYGHGGRVLGPVVGAYGGGSSDLAKLRDLAATELARSMLSTKKWPCHGRG